jgi:hypothetical protein
MGNEHYNKLLAFLQETSTAPYGVLESKGISKNMRPYRRITFGLARTLDASIDFYGPKFMVYRNSLGRNLLGEAPGTVFSSTEKMIERLKEMGF